MNEGLNQERTLLEALLYYLSVLFEHRWLIIAVTAASAIGVSAFCIASVRLPPQQSPLPNKYTASAIILVQKGAETDVSSAIRSALGIIDSPVESSSGFDSGAFLLMVLQSRTFLDKIAEEFGVVQKYRILDQVKSKSRKLLLANLHFENNRATSAITISYTDIDPVFARNLTNRMVTLLSEWYSENMGSSKQRQKKLLEEKIGEVNIDIDRLENRQNQLQKKYGALTAQDLGVSQASTLAALRSQLILKEIDIKNFENVSSAADPKMEQLQEERQNIVDQISRLQQGMPETADSTTTLTSLPDVQTAFNNLTVELDVQKKIANTLSHQYEVLKLTSDSEPPFQIMELAEIPDAKSGPQRTIIIAEVIAIALIASMALALLISGISRVRKAPKKLEIPGKEG
jgi:uncharacterized protein involved in exopolysaccharide biosynthesis